jgi:hypothetical protein
VTELAYALLAVFVALVLLLAVAWQQHEPPTGKQLCAPVADCYRALIKEPR